MKEIKILYSHPPDQKSLTFFYIFLWNTNLCCFLIFCQNKNSGRFHKKIQKFLILSEILDHFANKRYFTLSKEIIAHSTKKLSFFIFTFIKKFGKIFYKYLKQKSLQIVSYIYQKKVLHTVARQKPSVNPSLWSAFILPYFIFYFYTQLAFFHLLEDFYILRDHVLDFFLFSWKILIPFTRLLKHFTFEAFLWFFLIISG